MLHLPTLSMFKMVELIDTQKLTNTAKTQAYTDRLWCVNKLNRGLKLINTQTT
jgi:hypothetical protein